MGCKSSCVFDTSTCFKGILNPEKAATENKTAAEKLKKQETDFSTDKNVLRFSLKSGDSMKDSFTITNTKDKSDLEIEVPEDLKTILSEKPLVNLHLPFIPVLPLGIKRNLLIF